MDISQLSGRLIELRLLRRSDYADLAATCLEPDIWRETMAKMRTPDELSAYLDIGLRQHGSGEATPFVIRLKDERTAVGSTRVAKTAHVDTLEIGWTFISPAWHRKGINAEAKLLLLDHAFGGGKCRRVVFKVSAGNHRSMSSLTSFGAIPSLLTDLPSTSAHGDPIRWFEVCADSWPESRAVLDSRVVKALETAGT